MEVYTDVDVNRFYKELFEYRLSLDDMGLEASFRDMVKLVESETIQSFSQLIPAHIKVVLDLQDPANMVRKEYLTNGTEYQIRSEILDKWNLPILGVNGVEPANYGTVDPYDPDSSAYYSSIIASRNNLSLEGVLMGSEYTYNRTLVDSAVPFRRYKEYRGGGVLYLRNWNLNSAVVVDVSTNWPNLVSIPTEYWEQFMKLAQYDIKIDCWDALKYLMDIVTPVGNLDLKINEWESAERDRDEYRKELRRQSLPDRVGSSYFLVL